MPGTQFTGTVIVKLNGQYYNSDADASMQIGGFSHEAVPADGRSNAGTRSTPTAATGDCTFNHSADLDIAELAAMRNFSISYETDTGSIYSFANANWTEPPRLEAGGKIACSWVANPGKKVI